MIVRVIVWEQCQLFSGLQLQWTEGFLLQLSAFHKN